MFVVLLTYVKPLEIIDGLMRDHMAYLNKHYASGTFVVSGRRLPRSGGVIVATGHDLDLMKSIVDEDPFIKAGAATAEIIHFNASQTSPSLGHAIPKGS